jgi:hypothetical protein
LRALRGLLRTLWRRYLENRHDRGGVNALEGASPQILRDIGAAPALIAELEALDALKRGRAGTIHSW